MGNVSKWKTIFCGITAERGGWHGRKGMGGKRIRSSLALLSELCDLIVFEIDTDDRCNYAVLALRLAGSGERASRVCS